jgi:hypothetical protein
VIPKDFITEWREHAPWVTDAQVGQDPGEAIERCPLPVGLRPTG